MTKAQRMSGSKLSIFVSYYRPHIALFLADMACALGISLVDLAFPYVSKLSMERLLPERAFTAFFTVMVILLLAYVLRAGMYFVVTYLGHLMGVRIEADIREDLFSHMQKLSFGFYDKNRTGQLMSRVTNDLFEITELAHHGPEDLFISVVTLVGAFAIMFTIQWKLALVVLCIVPLFVLFTVIMRKRMMASSLEVKQTMAGINGDLESSISGMRTAKAFANEDQEIDKFHASNRRFRNAKKGYYRNMGYYQAGLEFSLPCMSVLVIAVGGLLIMREELSYIDLITFSLYITTFLTPIRKLAAFVEQFLNGMAGFNRFVELMRVEPDIQDTPGAGELTDIRGEIVLDDVSFSYDGQTPVLEHINLTVHPGETVAVVGPSGGGKSTLCQLIPRFYDVTAGAIRIDGQDVRTVTQKSLREQIGIVQQDVFLFAGTILDNIRYGRPNATDAEVVEAARRAEIYDDIMEMPDGFQTYVGERGVLLSGGQKQRVSIARIFLKNPPILILDEATSALDTVTEARIQSAFDQLAQGRTTLIIAHRLSTIRSAGHIVVIDGNSVAEEGTHEELMARGGEYARLQGLQQ